MKISFGIRKSVKALIVVLTISVGIMLSLIMSERGHIVSDKEPFVEKREVLFPKSDNAVLHTDSGNSRSSIKASAIMIGLPSLK